ncbi:MAG: BspA family leucine-rich repeat surface protein [Muricauda sp. TMED12]|nr:MAG: BspA family leucine-rich repeat surface protein [Muricauda sp. TMED12]
MNNKTYLFALLSLVLLWNCGKDDAPSLPKNNAPNIVPQNYTVLENITDNQLIGSVKATDADDDELTFSISQNDNGLFEITKTGELSLATGKVLDYDNKTQHTLTVAVTDGIDDATAQMTINVTKVEPENLSPSAEPQNFSVSEDISDTHIIGTLVATDPEDDTLTFSIVEDTDELFEITDTGELSLLEGKILDFETKKEHTLTVEVGDGNISVEFLVRIIVIDNIADDPDSFITKWQVNSGQEITIGTNPDYNYDYTIDWGDGTVEEITQQNPSHTYQDEGTYSVAIKGVFPAIQMSSSDHISRKSLVDVAQWGTGKWQSMYRSFYACQSLLTFSAEDTPDTSEVSSMQETFLFSDNFNGAIGSWNTGNVTNMHKMFFDATSFNQDLNDWDTSKVTNTSFMFYNAQSFNGIIGNWDTSNVQDMELMFLSASTFNQDISGWNTGNVTNMGGMFTNAFSFNQDIGGWNTGKVESMEEMFRGATVFNGDIGSWNTSNVANMRSMFMNAAAFNQDIGGWDTGMVTDMTYMFLGATNFNQNISQWNIGNVTSIGGMFSYASSFNQDIGGWNTANVTNMIGVLNGATAFNQNIGGWVTVNVTNMNQMFKNATAFDQDLGSWDISSIATMTEMLDSSGMSFNNANATLIGWADYVQQNEGPTDISLGMQDVVLCGMGADSALGILINDYSWNITGFDMQFNLCP